MERQPWQRATGDRPGCGSMIENAREEGAHGGTRSSPVLLELESE
jgi:hypothetical protein